MNILPRFAFLVATAVFSVASSLQAQMQRPDHDVDHRPVVLMQGLGDVHHTIHTTNPEAQKFFDQGMAFIYAFNHDEARRSFQHAAELDPAAPMPLWGVALAVGPNYNDIDIGNVRENAAAAAITKAKTLAATGSAVERDYVDALAQRFSADASADRPTLLKQYARAMKQLVTKYPDDLDAATLYAEAMMDIHPWQLWAADGSPTEGTLEIVMTLESVLKRDPNHLGANHFYIHAVEASPDPEVALASAKRMETMAPAAGHLVHMPAHIYQRVGEFKDAADANERAVQADRTYFSRYGLNGVVNMYDMMYYSHNMHFMASSCSMEGNFACARDASTQLAEHVLSEVPQAAMLEWFLPMQPWMLVRFQRWDDVLKTPLPDAKLKASTAIWHYARGLAYTGEHDLQQAAAEREHLSESIRTLPSDISPAFLNPAATVLNLALTVLNARIAEAKSDHTKAIELWRSAVKQQDALFYNEPPDWYYPIRESLGGALLRDGQATEAETIFRDDLKQNPRSGRSLFGLYQSLKAQHRDADAAWVETQFKAAWKDADSQITVNDL